MDIDRKYKGQLKSALPAPVPPTSSPPFSSSSYSSVPGRSLGGYGFTAMQRHRERTVQCRVCSALYLETQNNSFSCRTHSAVRRIQITASTYKHSHIGTTQYTTVRYTILHSNMSCYIIYYTIFHCTKSYYTMLHCFSCIPYTALTLYLPRKNTPSQRLHHIISHNIISHYTISHYTISLDITFSAFLQTYLLQCPKTCPCPGGTLLCVSHR